LLYDKRQVDKGGPMTNTLKHVGVLGMHWGIHKRGPSSTDHLRTRELAKKRTHELTNDELKTAITRLSLEKQYKDLTSASIGKGRRLVSEILQKVGAQLINNYAKGQVDPIFVEAFKKARGKG
jgi:hypothetical protein